MEIGKVKWFNAEKGWGFIERDAGGKDVFAHYSAILSDGYRTLEAGDTVSFDVNPTDKGYEARNISVVYLSEENE